MPHFVLRHGGRRAMITSIPLLVPLVHHFWIEMGMIHFALALPLSMWCAMGLEKQDARPTTVRALGLTLLTIVIWYAHPFPVMLLCLLALGAAARATNWRARFARAIRLGLPLAPAFLLSFVAAVVHVGFKPTYSTISNGIVYDPLPNMLYDLWGRSHFGYTIATITSLPLAVALIVVAAIRWSKEHSNKDVLFSSLAFVLLAGGYLVTPAAASGWGYVGARFIPFLWYFALAWVPPIRGKWLQSSLIVCAALYVVGLNTDMIRLAREAAQLGAARPLIPIGARILPLVFQPRIISQNARNLLSASGLYTVDRLTNAEDVFADARSMPLVRTRPVPPRFDRPHLEQFMRIAGKKSTFCAATYDFGLDTRDCEARWQQEWASLWQDTRERYGYVLLFVPPDEVLTTLPQGFSLIFSGNGLFVYRIEAADKSSLRAASSLTLPSPRSLYFFMHLASRFHFFLATTPSSFCSSHGFSRALIFGLSRTDGCFILAFFQSFQRALDSIFGGRTGASLTVTDCSVALSRGRTRLAF